MLILTIFIIVFYYVKLNLKNVFPKNVEILFQVVSFLPPSRYNFSSAEEKETMDVMINSKLLVITPQRKYVFRVGYFLDKILIVSPISFKLFFFTHKCKVCSQDRECKTRPELCTAQSSGFYFIFCLEN